MKRSAHIKGLIVPLSIVALVLSGCSSQPTVRAYAGNQLTKNEVAVINPTSAGIGGVFSLSNGQFDVYILKIDERELSEDEVSHHALVEVLPGEHSLNVLAMVKHNAQYSKFNDPNPLRFKAEAGQQYLVKSRGEQGAGAEQSIVRFWIEDLSGNVVAGTK